MVSPRGRIFYEYAQMTSGCHRLLQYQLILFDFTLLSQYDQCNGLHHNIDTAVKNYAYHLHKVNVLLVPSLAIKTVYERLK